VRNLDAAGDGVKSALKNILLLAQLYGKGG
jgi:hypothetical protein